MRQEPETDRQSARRVNASRRWYWVTIAVLALGILSILLLAWINRINQRQRMATVLTNTLLETRAKVGAFHLQLEEAIAGDPRVDIEGAWVELEQAFSLVEKILNGGGVEDGVILSPLEDSRQRRQVEEIGRVLTELKTIATQRWQAPKTSGIGSAMDRQFDDIFHKIQHKTRVLGAVIKDKERSERIRSGRLFSGILITWTSIIAVSILGLWTSERRRRAAEKALQVSYGQLQEQTGELDRHRQHLAALVEERTAELTSANRELQQKITECNEINEAVQERENQLRHLSSELLTAQEAERKRISRELHDEMGGRLAALKMGLSYVEKGLREDQIPLRERCSRNFEIIDQIIDNVYRLSRNLSPYLLEDLGLSASLRSLVDGFKKDFHHVSASVDIPDIDPLFPQNAQIIIFRILQESLTNIGKHSGARNVSVVIVKQKDSIALIVEDDGKGFDMREVFKKDPLRRGLGLTTMDERVRMLGGAFSQWSQDGKGTRITFTIPVRKEDS